MSIKEFILGRGPSRVFVNIGKFLMYGAIQGTQDICVRKLKLAFEPYTYQPKIHIKDYLPFNEYALEEIKAYYD